MASESKYTLNQKMLIDEGRDTEVREGRVVKIGRKLLTVKIGAREEQFVIATGRGHKNQSGWGSTIYTEDEWASIKRRGAAKAAIREAGIDVIWNREHEISTETLEKLAAVLRSDPVPPTPINHKELVYLVLSAMASGAAYFCDKAGKGEVALNRPMTEAFDNYAEEFLAIRTDLVEGLTREEQE